MEDCFASLAIVYGAVLWDNFAFALYARAPKKAMSGQGATHL